MEKECEIIGFGTYNDKETQEKKIRVILGVDRKRENYWGLTPAVAFLDHTTILENKLIEYKQDITKTKKAYYETEEDITTGKTKVVNIIIK